MMRGMGGMMPGMMPGGMPPGGMGGGMPAGGGRPMGGGGFGGGRPMAVASVASAAEDKQNNSLYINYTYGVYNKRTGRYDYRPVFYVCKKFLEGF